MPVAHTACSNGCRLRKHDDTLLNGGITQAAIATSTSTCNASATFASKQRWSFINASNAEQALALYGETQTDFLRSSLFSWLYSFHDKELARAYVLQAKTKNGAKMEVQLALQVA